MAAQLTGRRIARAFPRPAMVAVKSGSLLGIIRNEAGVITLPGGRRYAVAVFTRAHEPWARENDIDAAIGTAAAQAVSALEAGQAGGYVLMEITLPDPDCETEMVAPWPDFLMVRLPLQDVMLLETVVQPPASTTRM